jgi:hypothetical protein
MPEMEQGPPSGSPCPHPLRAVTRNAYLSGLRNDRQDAARGAGIVHIWHAHEPIRMHDFLPSPAASEDPARTDVSLPPHVRDEPGINHSSVR